MPGFTPDWGKDMKYLMLAGSLLLGALGTAGAEDFRWTPPPCDPKVTGCSTGNGVVDVQKEDQVFRGNLSSTLTENITVSIPAVVAMHLHEKSWTVDLFNLKNCDCYRAGEHNPTTGRDDVIDIEAIMNRAGTYWKGDNQAISGNPYSFAGTVNLAGLTGLETQLKNRGESYPGIVYDNAKGSVTWKGPIICFNRKIVEKFTNSTNWKVNVSVSGVTAGFPKLVLGDMLPGTMPGGVPNGAKFVKTLYSNGVSGSLDFTNTQAGLGGKTTGGWLDDYILEALVFDGSETAGDKTAAVNFKLTGTF